MIEGEEIVMGSDERIELDVILFSVILPISSLSYTIGERKGNLPGGIPFLVLGSFPSSIT
jgi:hypothetical protein